MFSYDKIVRNIKELRRTSGLSQSAFADKLSLKQSMIADIESGKTKPSLAFLNNIMEIFNIPIDILIYKNLELAAENDMNIMPSGRFATIPYYPDVMASAGGGIMNSYEGSEPFTIDKSLIDNPNTEVIINVIGESMEPTLKNGEKILVDTNQNNISLKPDKIYVVLTDGTVVVKRYSGRQGTLCIFSSDNKVFQPFTVDLANEDNKVIGVVKGIVYRKMN